MKPLDGAGIARALTGKWIEPDPNVSQAAFRFSEEFHADGVWISRREQRALVTETGRWAVQGNQICVTANSKPPQCREVWGDASLRRIAIADRGSVSMHSVQILMKVENIN